MQRLESLTAIQQMTITINTEDTVAAIDTEQSRDTIMYTVFQKTGILSKFNNFVNFQRIIIILSLTHSEENLQ